MPLLTGFNGVPYTFTDLYGKLELYMLFFIDFNGVSYVPLFTGFNGVPYIFTDLNGKFELYMPFFITGLGCPLPFVALLLPGLPACPGLAVRAEAGAPLWQRGHVCHWRTTRRSRRSLAAGGPRRGWRTTGGSNG